MSRPAGCSVVLQARCLELLRAADKPIVAADLAGRLGLAGTRETQRRKVRAMVKNLRDDGAMIVATIDAGYFLTDDRKIFQDYLDGKQISAKQVIGETGRRKKMIRDSHGQGMLFKPGVSLW